MIVEGIWMDLEVRIFANEPILITPIWTLWLFTVLGFFVSVFLLFVRSRKKIRKYAAFTPLAIVSIFISLGSGLQLHFYYFPTTYSAQGRDSYITNIITKCQEFREALHNLSLCEEIRSKTQMLFSLNPEWSKDQLITQLLPPEKEVFIRCQAMYIYLVPISSQKWMEDFRQALFNIGAYSTQEIEERIFRLQQYAREDEKIAVLISHELVTTPEMFDTQILERLIFRLDKLLKKTPTNQITSFSSYDSHSFDDDMRIFVSSFMDGQNLAYDPENARYLLEAWQIAKEVALVFHALHWKNFLYFVVTAVLLGGLLPVTAPIAPPIYMAFGCAVIEIAMLWWIRREKKKTY